MSTAHVAIASAPAAKQTSGARAATMNRRRCTCGTRSGEGEYCSHCGGLVLQRSSASDESGYAADPLEREADRAADSVMSGRNVARIDGVVSAASRVQRSAIYNRVPVGTSSRIKTGKLIDWDYVVYEDHVRLGNRVFDKDTKQVIGSWPWLTNNPGDITVDPKESGKPRSNLNRAYEWGAVKDKAASTGHIPLAIFPDGATGAAALKKLYAEPDYRDKTMKAAIEVHLGRKETRVPGVDDPKKYLDRVKERARKLGVKDELLDKTLADLDAAGVMDAVVEGFGVAEGYENVGITYTCVGRDKTDDSKIPQTVRNLRLFKNLPDQTPDEVLRLLGCKVPSGEASKVQKKAVGPEDIDDDETNTPADRASVAQALGSSSRALPSPVHRLMEHGFGRDFSRVRVHVDTAANASARQVMARAYTVGNDIVFAEGEFAPDSQAGQRLISHELAHVVQQTRPGPVSSTAALEREADSVGATVTTGRAVPPSQAAAPNSVQRDGEPDGAVLHRKCACGGSAGSSGSCDECERKEVLQRQADTADPHVRRQSPDDERYETEADRIADQVVSRSSDGITSPNAEITATLATQRRTLDGASVSHEVLPLVAAALAEPGAPLDKATHAFMAQRFGVDFSSVRVHTDATAAQSARMVRARAYTVGRDIVFGPGEYSPHGTRGRRLLAHELAHTVQQTGSGLAAPTLPRGTLQRDEGDPLEEAAGVKSGAVQAIAIDPGSGRTRFYTAGGKSFDGKVLSLAARFQEGDYLLERASGNDPKRTWNIFNVDGSIYRGGLQFNVVLEGVDFDSLGYTPKVQLKVASGLLPKLIDIEARIKGIKEQVAKTRVNDVSELAILRLLEDIPPEQAAEFVKRLREESVGDEPLLARLDRKVDGENNIALHQHLSRLKLQAGGVKSAAALVDAPTLAWHDVMGFFEQTAVFSVTPSGKGKYRIRYLGGISSGLYSAPEYSEIKGMGRKDRLAIMTGQGIEVDADQPIIVHDYDNDRQVVLTAEDLIAYQHAGTRKFLSDVGTVAALATPVGAESVGARVLGYGVQVLTAATLIVDENKLNIRKWFPNWGPAIITLSERIKVAIAIVGIAQLVRGGWKLFTDLRALRAARATMDKAVATTAEGLLAERQAARLEANADRLLNQAELARKELGIADEAAAASQKVEGGAKPVLAEAAAVATPPAAKARIVEAAIGKSEFSGEFANLVNRELSDAVQNHARLKPARVSGYSVEVQIEGTEHFLARKPGGTWCLFSSTPKGCGAISVAATVDELFADIGRELGTSKAVKIGNTGRVDIASAVADAKQAGFIGAAGEPVGVNLAVQPHSAASEVRGALGVSGKDVQSAHHAPTAGVKTVAGYSREGALTVLLPRATHKAFDDYWKQWAIAQRQAGATHVTVERFVGIVDRAIQQTPNIDAKTKGAMSFVLQKEFYRDLGLKPTDLIPLPYPNVKP